MIKLSYADIDNRAILMIFDKVDHIDYLNNLLRSEGAVARKINLLKFGFHFKYAERDLFEELYVRYCSTAVTVESIDQRDTLNIVNKGLAYCKGQDRLALLEVLQLKCVNLINLQTP